MVLYLIIISVCGVLDALFVSLAYEASFLWTLLWTALAIVTVILVDGLVATVCRLLPQRFANSADTFYQVSQKEKKFYEKLKIRKWKDKIPEIGHFTGFRKNKIAQPQSVEYVERFLLEACYGELGHLWIMPIGFVILALFFISETWIALAIPVAIINAILNVLPVFVLRYNRYKLEILRKNLLKKQERASA
ncbi:MAG: hypothetical protein IJ996_00920 [Clostridia bacterium]|nr:hypothetical protein [Clostridia bacterium]